jgi:SMC interacting uncharacterized protein involved in chromosome segregation
MEDVHVQLERVEQRAKSNTHQIQEIKDDMKEQFQDVKEEIKELKEENKAIYKIATSVELIAQKLGSIEEKVDDTAAAQRQSDKRSEENYNTLIRKINTVECAPDVKKSQGLEKIKIAVITAVATTVAVTVVVSVLQLAFGG